MGERARRHFDVRIEPLAESHIEEAARIHARCFPDKIETLLGLDCIREVYRERFLGPRRDTFCLVAIHVPDGRLAAYLYGSDLVPQSSSPHAFINQAIAKRHLLKSGWYRPRIWKFLLNRVLSRLFGKHQNESAVVPVPQWGCVAKMLGIHPDFRGGNVGVDLMLAIEGEAMKRGARRLYGLVERTNIKAERLYASIGWVRTNADSDKWQVFSMHKDLFADSQPVDPAPVPPTSPPRNPLVAA